MTSWRPIEAEERPYLLALGDELKWLRTESGLIAWDLADGALITHGQLRAIMAGRRRTRRSTLTRIAEALVDANPAHGPAGQLVDHLCDVVGPALAPESTYVHAKRTVERKRRRRDRGYWVP